MRLITAATAFVLLGLPRLQAATFGVLYSRTSDRANPLPLDGASVSGHIYIFMPPDSSTRRVRWSIDGAPYRTDRNSPFDLVGGTANVAEPFNVNQLTNGPHAITAAVTRR